MRGVFRLLTALRPKSAAALAAYLFATPRARTFAPAERRYLSTARCQAVPTAAGLVHIYDWPATGPAVIVQHGWIAHSGRMRGLIDALRQRGLRVIACDAPAHGRSPGRRTDLQGFVAALEAVNDYCGGASAIVAHSFGAMAAAHWLVRGGQRTVRAAVLVGMPRDFTYLLDAFALGMGLRADVNALMRQRLRAASRSDPEQFSVVALAPGIHIPVLLVHGQEDELIPPEHSVELASMLHAATARVLPKLNHSAPLNDPAAIKLMVDFVATQMAAGGAQ